MLNKTFVTNSKPVEAVLILSGDNFLMDPRAPNQMVGLGIQSVMLGQSRHVRRTYAEPLHPITQLLGPQTDKVLVAEGAGSL